MAHDISGIIEYIHPPIPLHRRRTGKCLWFDAGISQQIPKRTASTGNGDVEKTCCRDCLHCRAEQMHRSGFRFGFCAIGRDSRHCELAKSMGYDPSYLSRIKKGQRMPADITKFSGSFSSFLLRKYGESEKMEQICKQINCSAEKEHLSRADFTAAVTQYLCSHQPKAGRIRSERIYDADSV